ncbi:unnamed protein product [Prorocentrum cordatum]|uniref:Uncharacterized protein n=1 Tax=Prorocentrum cordatum TaxID=2364126 RepID=A0ABN9RBU8_9DINO|nr:unnamed protein product [Polarella glacialis]
MALFNLKGNIPRRHHLTYRVSLAFSICGGFLSIFGLSESLSCVTYTDEQRGFPARCGFPSDVELQRHWCWEPSHFSKFWVWCWALALLIDVVLEATGQFTLFTSQRPANFVHPCISAPVIMVATLVWGEEMANMMEWRSRSRHVDNRQRGTAGLWGLSKICTLASAFELTRTIACDYTPRGVVLRCSLKSGGVRELRVSPESEIFGLMVPTSAPIHMVAAILAWCLLVAACALKLCTKLDWVSEDEVSKDIAEEAKRLLRATTTLVADVEAGKTVVPVAADTGFADGDLITIGCRGQVERDRRVVGFRADSPGIFILDCAVQHAYAAGSRVSPVRPLPAGGRLLHGEPREGSLRDRAVVAVLRCLPPAVAAAGGAVGSGGASTTLAAAAPRGATALTVASQAGFSAADVLEISDGSSVESRVLSKSTSQASRSTPQPSGTTRGAPGWSSRSRGARRRSATRSRGGSRPRAARWCSVSCPWLSA